MQSEQLPTAGAVRWVLLMPDNEITGTSIRDNKPTIHKDYVTQSLYHWLD